MESESITLKRNNKTIQFLIVVFLGAGLVVTPPFISEESHWLKDLSFVFGGALISGGLTILLSIPKKLKTSIDYGIEGLFHGRLELKKQYNYNHIIQNYSTIDFIGVKHSDFLKNLDSLKEILTKKSRHSDFRIRIYFLNPLSKHRLLFFDSLSGNKTEILKQTIRNNIADFQTFIENNDLDGCFQILEYDYIPLGNIIILDDKFSIFNQYNYFRTSTELIWFKLRKANFGLISFRYRDYLHDNNKIKTNEV